jgi:type IV pilus assembly protein PilV
MYTKKSQGFTIIEVLVSMVILSIGVLALGMLQLSALQNTQGGYQRSQATILAYDIIDSMRANIPSVTAGDYGLAIGAQTPAAVNCNGVAANCTTTQMATSDLNRWRTVLSNYLPIGNGSVATVDVAGLTQVTVTIQWLDPFSAEGGNEQLVLVSQLNQ